MESPKSILFLMRNLYYLRNFEAPLRVLLEGGCRITILSDPSKDLPDEILQQQGGLLADFPGRIGFGDSHGRLDNWAQLASELHCARNILRYHDERFANAQALKQRALRKATPLANLFCRPPFVGQRASETIDGRLARLDGRLPVDSEIRQRIEAITPDIVVVTPLIDFRTMQGEWVRAAQALGIPTVLAVASWDNLTNKGRIQAMPDRVIIWNEVQKREAMVLHHVPEERIVVTGAQLYDHWFGRHPSTDRATYCEEMGFDADQPIILYLGSSLSIAANEPAFVRRWLKALRHADDPILRQANVLVRPHPMNQRGYEKVDVTKYLPAAIYPRSGGFPVTAEAQSEYFDALYHCDAIVGLNTSALIEASILGKRCLTLTDPANAKGQEETLHFQHLVNGGVVRCASDFPHHLQELADELRCPDQAEDLRDFVRTFLRPHGIDRPATPIFVEALMTTERCTVQAAPVPWSVREKIGLHSLRILANVSHRFARRATGIGRRARKLWPAAAFRRLLDQRAIGTTGGTELSQTD